MEAAEQAAELPPFETANTFSHAVGIVLSAAGLGYLLWLTGGPGVSRDLFFASLVYGLTLVNVYVASTFCHGIRDRRRKRWFEIADHAAIYLLIAGTFTPFGVRIGGALGTGVIFALWICAALGVAFKILCGCGKRLERVSLATYIAMGWGPVLVIEQLLAATSRAALQWLVVGGLLYTLGVPFYVLSHRRPHLHVWWHLFVMAGSTSHFIAVLLCVGMAV